MPKLTLDDLASLTNQTSAINTINENNAAIETAIENTLSRDGSTPNSMEADLDMNSNRVLNLASPINSHEAATKAYVDSLALSGATVTINPGLEPVNTRTVLKGVDTSIYNVVFLEEPGREGIFVFRSGDYSTEVTADTREAIYIAATDTPSSNGAWVRVYNETIYANWWGLVADGVGGTDNSAALQAAIDFRDVGKLVIPPGDYEVTTKLDIAAKNNINDSTQKNYLLEGYGAVLHFSSIAAGNTCVLFDDCKSVHVRGLEIRSPNRGRIELDGFWRGKFEDCTFAQTILQFAPQDLGSFDSHYWNHFDRCHFLAVEFHTGISGGDLTETNGNVWTQCVIAPRPELSETGQAYAISYYGTGRAQSNRFNSCDISYYTTGGIYIDDTLEDASIDFENCYLDSALQFIPSDRKGLRVNFHGTNMAANSPIADQARLAAGSKETLSLYGGVRNGSRLPLSGLNLIKNGDFSDGVTEIVFSSGGSGITAAMEAGEGLFGQYVNITTSLNRSATFESIELPFDGYYTFTVIARNNGDAIRTAYLVNSVSTVFDAIDVPTDGEWTLMSFSPATALSQGDVVGLNFFGASTYNLDYDIAYIGLTYGSSSSITASAHPDAGSAAQHTYRGISTIPNAPATGRYRRFIDDIGFAWIQDENGRLRIDNPGAANNVVGIRAVVNSTTVSTLGAFLSTSHGTATAQALASTNYFTRKPRQLNVSAESSAANCGQSFNTFVYLTDPGRARIVAGWETFQSGAAALIGLTTNSALGDADASARTNFMGLGLDAGDTNWSIMHNDGTGSATEIPLGANYPANTSATDLYELILWWDASPTEVNYQVCRLNSPANTAQGKFTTNIPSTTNNYTLHVLGNTRAGSSAIGLSWSSVYLETL